MKKIMTIRTQQYPFTFFRKNKFFIIGRKNQSYLFIIFSIHFFRVVVKSITSYWKIFDFTVTTKITKLQNKFCFNILSVFISLGKILFSFFRHTISTKGIKFVPVFIIFSKIKKWLIKFTRVAPFLISKFFRFFRLSRFSNCATFNIKFFKIVMNRIFRQFKLFSNLITRFTKDNILICKKLFSEYHNTIVAYCRIYCNGLITSIV